MSERDTMSSAEDMFQIPVDDCFSSFLEDFLDDGSSQDAFTIPLNVDFQGQDCSPLNLEFKPATEKSFYVSEEKKEIIREKNRKKQRAYRERCKVQIQDLESKQASVRSQLAEAKSYVKALCRTRETLLARLLATPQNLPSNPNAGSLYAGQTAPSLPSACSLASALGHPFGRDLVTTWRSTSIFTCNQRNPDDDLSTPCPIHKFKYCLPISYSRLMSHVASQPLFQNLLSHNFPNMIRSYQRWACEATGALPEHTCWFSEWETPEITLLFTYGGNSMECILAVTLVVMVGAFESLLLYKQHEMMVKFKSPSQPQAEKPIMPEACRAVPEAPAAPDPNILAKLRLRCANHEMRPLAEVVQKIISPMLEKYREELPYEEWRGACLLFLDRLLQSTPTLPSHQPEDSNTSSEKPSAQHFPPSNSQGSPREEAQGKEEGWGLLDAGMLTLNQVVACCLHTALLEASNSSLREEAVPHKQQPLEAVHLRMEALAGSNCMSTLLFLSLSPVLLRRMMYQQARLMVSNRVPVERKLRRLYRDLKVTAAQRRDLAGIWKEWCRRREALDAEFWAAVAALSSSSAPSDAVPPHLLALLDCFHPNGCSFLRGAATASNGSHPEGEATAASTHPNHTHTVPSIIAGIITVHEPQFGGFLVPLNDSLMLEPRWARVRVSQVFAATASCAGDRLEGAASLHASLATAAGPSEDACYGASPVQEAVEEGGVPAYVPLGSNAGQLRECRAALDLLLSSHLTDRLLQDHSFASPLFHLTIVQHAKLMASFFEHGLSNVGPMEMMKIAAMDLLHEEVLGDLHLWAL